MLPHVIILGHPFSILAVSLLVVAAVVVFVVILAAITERRPAVPVALGFTWASTRALERQGQERRRFNTIGAVVTVLLLIGAIVAYLFT